MANDQDITIQRRANDLLEWVKVSTQSHLGDSCSALYAYGSYVTGGMDSWSDLDVAAIEQEGTPVEVLQAWWTDLKQHGMQEGMSIDATSLRPQDISASGHWSDSPVVAALKQESTLLTGTDCRADMSYPTDRKMQVALVNSAMMFLRHLYSIDRSETVPLASAPPSALSARHLPSMGNWIWLVAIWVLHTVRALLYLRAGRVVRDKRELVDQLQGNGMVREARLAEAVAAVRKTLPRWGEWEGSSESVQSLCAAVPALHADLRNLMEGEGMVDPSYQPSGKSLYTACGDLVENAGIQDSLGGGEQ